MVPRMCWDNFCKCGEVLRSPTNLGPLGRADSAKDASQDSELPSHRQELKRMSILKPYVLEEAQKMTESRGKGQQEACF
ncbi:hypothetical protein H920_03560 [Fukomys damarensis]|uniref:Uncharacterized protein n=1 Tax=Fukomys damarensis TaxID=885580 RepID=A0A091DX48_FUKDA|nr:hypothetical protein H920_03560 [Fukomys damarensis]